MYELDVLLIGGGIAGMWTLDALRRRGIRAALVERDALGAGQTLWSQGIIHGGLKYTLAGLMNPSAEAIRDMPALWRACLAGEREPDLRPATIRSQHCHLWRTDTIASRVGMIGAKMGLRIRPVGLVRDERPAVLRDCPGEVARLDEQVIDPGAVLAALAKHSAGRIVTGEVVAAEKNGDAWVVRVAAGHEQRLRARAIVLTAGNGIPALRRMLNLDPGRAQTRPLRMALLRGPAESLHPLYGHCVDGSRTRVTVTSATDRAGRRVWQVGGEVAEVGPSMRDPLEFLRHARAELRAAIPGLETPECAWSFYDAPRAEAATATGRRPDDAAVITEGRVITAWPTKLALAPRAAERVIESLEALGLNGAGEPDPPGAFGSAPEVSVPPWDAGVDWFSDDRLDVR